MIICGKCGVQLPDDVKFCLKCGSKVGRDQPTCNKCGTPINPNSKFCSSCGILCLRQYLRPQYEKLFQSQFDRLSVNCVEAIIWSRKTAIKELNNEKARNIQRIQAQSNSTPS